MHLLNEYKNITLQIIERLSEHAARHLSARNFDGNAKTVCGKSLSVPLSGKTSELNDRRKPLGMHFIFERKKKVFEFHFERKCVTLFIIFVRSSFIHLNILFQFFSTLSENTFMRSRRLQFIKLSRIIA